MFFLDKSSNTCHIYSQMKARSDILRMSDGAVEGGQNQKNYIHRTSKSDIGLSGGYQKYVLNIRTRHLSDIRRTALCYVGETPRQLLISQDGGPGVIGTIEGIQILCLVLSLEVFNLSACAANTLICPVDCLGQYVFRSDFLRNANNQSKLFIGLRKPHRQVSGSTVGRWVKDYLSLAGVNSLVFSAHSTRGGGGSIFQGGIYGCPHRLHFGDGELVQPVHICTILSSFSGHSHRDWGLLEFLGAPRALKSPLRLT
ncbi:Uncharacterized protein APZ42_033570 [Daphnia magna]|uniref:Tyr recombinase domain-containing protein n=1 Tax=Daphnia magna TaxID=35525 RepID=A0A164KZ05_9CRUS|nr:Uncharacterized protein APZ42_033570 [Daphnia magna]